MIKRQWPTRVGETMQSVLQRVDPDQKMRAYRLWTFWDEEVGESVAAHTQPLSIRSGVLSVQVDSSTWMQELQFLKEGIRDRLNQRLGAELIREIYFVSGAPRQKAEPEKPTAPVGRAPRPLAMPRIRNGEIAEVFKRIARAHVKRER